jgi:hypothetical protein
MNSQVDCKDAVRLIISIFNAVPAGPWSCKIRFRLVAVDSIGIVTNPTIPPKHSPKIVDKGTLIIPHRGVAPGIDLLESIGHAVDVILVSAAGVRLGLAPRTSQVDLQGHIWGGSGLRTLFSVVRTVPGR